MIQSVGLLNSPPIATRPHGGNCASVLKLKWPAAAQVAGVRFTGIPPSRTQR